MPSRRDPSKACLPSPKELDAQSEVHVDCWIDMDDPALKFMDDSPEFTQKCLRLGFQDPPFFFVDSLGRIWGKSDDSDKYFPFYFEYGNKIIGYSMAKRIPN